MIKNIFVFIGTLLIGALVMIYVMFIHLQTYQITGQEATPTPSPQFQYSINNPPKETLKGKITFMSGSVNWQSRIATEPAKLQSLIPVQQGESIETGDDGVSKISFDNVLNIVVSQKSEIDFTQTLPVDFVINQKQGIVEYERIGELPVSVRVKHLLIDQEKGDILVSVGESQNIVQIEVRTGKITVAFNDLDLNSKTLTIDSGKKFIFDDSTRLVEIKPI